MPSKTIVILGGGVVAANRLRERLTADHRVVVVERDAEHRFAPSFLWLMTGDRKPDQVRRPLADLVRRGIECRHTTAETLDLSGRRVFTNAGEIPITLNFYVADRLFFPAESTRRSGFPVNAHAEETWMQVAGNLELQDLL